MVKYFCYLGQNLTATDNDWSEVVENLRKEIWTWARILRVLGREGVDVRTPGIFYM